MNYDIFADEKKTEETVIEVNSSKLLDLPTEGTDTLTSRDDEKKDEAEEAPSEETDKKDVIEVDKDFPKKDLGVGGASFVDEFLKCATDEQIAMLKCGKRTLAGFWNWSYSKVRAEYVKACGRVNGGVFSDVSALASEYFSDAVREGTVVECDEYKVKSPTPPKTTEKKETKKATKRKSAKKAVVEVAKMAVADAKKEDESKGGKKCFEKDMEKIKERIAMLSGDSVTQTPAPVKQSRMLKRFSSIFKR